jgi:molybdate transport repressor ModE-like protein/molybdopterin-binding protein
MSFRFEDRTRELLRGVWLQGTISAAAARIGMDPGNAVRHLRTAERRAGVPLVERRRGGRGGRNARLTRQARRFLEAATRIGTALAYDEDEGVTPVRIGGRILYAGGVVAAGPVDVEIRPESVALERSLGPRTRTSVRNRFPARVERVEPAADGVFRLELSAGALRLESLVVQGALRDLRLRVGSRVYATIKAVSIAAAARS